MEVRSLQECNSLRDNRGSLLIRIDQGSRAMPIKPTKLQLRARPRLEELHTFKTPMLVRGAFLDPISEKVLPNQVSGDGIKKTPAYETPMTKHDLDKWRKEFWGKYQVSFINQ